MSSAKDNTSIFSKGMKIVGEINATGVLEIEGEVNGNITGDVVTIRETGFINGDVRAKTLNIKGRFKGNIVSSRINVSDTAIINGIVEYEFLSVDYGADMNCEFKRIKDTNQKAQASNKKEKELEAAEETEKKK